jgi:ABC-type dipeptide/oligopeptide/nickel transport system permease subunit
MIRLLILVCFATFLFAPLLAPHDPMQTDREALTQPPDSRHLLGTDQLGRDVFSRLLYGGRTSTGLALIALGIGVITGGSIGLVAGFFGGRVDQMLLLVINALLSIPGLLIGLMIVTLLGQGLLSAALAVGISQTAPFAQVARTLAISNRNTTYVTAAYAIGATRFHIWRQHIVPACLPLLRTQTGVTFSYCLMNIAAFGFLGLVGTPGLPEWGVMLAEGREAIREAPWISTAPGLAISLVVFSINSLIDDLNRNR